MIVFDLKCERSGHVFEAWFGSTSEYEDQSRRGLVQCPLCGDVSVTKAVMAPNVAPKGNRQSLGSPAEAPNPEKMKAMMAALATAQKQILENSSFVGDRFADEARSIHLGETAARSIHGRATRAEAEKLSEEGIPVSPLPFPVMGPGEEN
jgi:hypothetical protein